MELDTPAWSTRSGAESRLQEYRSLLKIYELPDDQDLDTETVLRVESESSAPYPPLLILVCLNDT